MTSSKAAPPKQTTHHHQWRTFTEFTLSSEPHTAPLTIDLVAGIVQTLNWPAARLEQLKLALTRAIDNVQERSQLNNSGTSLVIRLFVSGGWSTSPKANRPCDEPKPPRPPLEAIQTAGQSSPDGWSFFLVQKHEEASPVLVMGSHHLIELFLYQENIEIH